MSLTSLTRRIIGPSLSQRECANGQFLFTRCLYFVSPELDFFTAVSIRRMSSYIEDGMAQIARLALSTEQSRQVRVLKQHFLSQVQG